MINLAIFLAITSFVFTMIGILASVEQEELHPKLWVVNRSLGVRHSATLLMLTANLILLLHIAQNLK